MTKITLIIGLILLSVVSFGKNYTNHIVYIRGGYSFPTWKPVGWNNKSDWEGGYDKYGITGEFGTIFMLPGISPSRDVTFGIDADYLSATWHYFKNSVSALDLHFLKLSSKIGPSVTFDVSDEMAIDLFAKADIGWATGVAYIYDHLEDDDVFTNFVSVGFEAGFNVRIREFMIGIEYNSINPKLKNGENEEINTIYLGNRSSSTSDKTPISSINFMLGIIF